MLRRVKKQCHSYARRVVFLTVVVLSMVSHSKAMNADSLFIVARDTAIAGDYIAARSMCDSILIEVPEYADVLILKGRTYAWEKQYDSARTILNRVLETAPDNEDAYVALTDNEIWAGNYGKAEKICRSGLQGFPASFMLLFKLAQIQYRLVEYYPALQSVDSALVQKPENEDAIKLREAILAQLRQDRVRVNHSVEWFNEPFDRGLHISYVEYLKKMNKLTLIPRVNMGQAVYDTAALFTDLHPQIEADVYYQLSGWNYIYFNYGYAFRDFFPKHRHGLEWFQKLPYGFEASLGYRLLYFSGSGANDDKFVDIYTGSLGKYWKNYWFAFRAYITPQTDGGVNNSYTMLARYFYKTADDFVELSLTSGYSVDESTYAQQVLQSTTYLHNYRIASKAQYRYKSVCILHVGAALGFQEYFHKTNRNVYYLEAGVSFFLGSKK